MIRMIDAPAAFAQVYVVVRRVEIHRADFSNETGWRVVGDALSKVDILALRNGRSDTLVLKDVPTGDYNKVRILFGISQVFLVGSSVPLTVDIPPEIVNGFIVEHSFRVEEGQSYELVMDIDATHSIRATTGNQYKLVPVIRLQSAATAGSIAGAVLGSGGPVGATVSTAGGGVSASTLNDVAAGGSFLLDAVPEGFYNVVIQPTDTAVYKDTTLYTIQVLRKALTTMPTVVLRSR